jgi:hypothetical protein
MGDQDFLLQKVLFQTSNLALFGLFGEYSSKVDSKAISNVLCKV